MQTQYLIIAAVVLAIVVGFAVSRRKRKREETPWPDVVIPMPATLRTDLHNVYYIGLDGQLDQYGDHVSLFWFTQWFPLDSLAAMLARYPGIDLIIDVAPQVLPPRWADENREYRLPPVHAVDARQQLAGLFGRMRAAGIIHRVRYIVPMDEPNLFCNSEADLRGAVRDIKAEIAAWPELAGVKMTCIYGGDGKSHPFWCLDEFDIVGIDNYSQRSGVLVGDGAHARLLRELRQGQRTMIIPGPAYGQDPAPFVAYAHSHPEQVEMVVPFIWSHVSESADKEGWVGLERRTAAERELWRQAGKTILNRSISFAG